jgi:ribosome-interacting GTPase 1
MVLDAAREENNQHRDILTRELEIMGIRLNRNPPDIYFKKLVPPSSHSMNHPISSTIEI